MANPTNRVELIDWCLRKLGAPVIEINVDPDQVEDRVDEALKLYQQFHYDAVEKVFLSHALTSQDISNKYIPIPAPVTSVIKVLPTSSTANNPGMFDIQYQFRLNDLYTFNSTSIIHYDMMQRHLALLQFEFNTEPSLRFNRHQQQLRIEIDWTAATVGQYYIIECYRILDPETYPDVWSDYWLLKYTTCLIKLQWATNISKFARIQQMGGVELNGVELYQQALAEQEKLEQELHDCFEAPISFIMG